MLWVSHGQKQHQKALRPQVVSVWPSSDTVTLPVPPSSQTPRRYQPVSSPHGPRLRRGPRGQAERQRCILSSIVLSAEEQSHKWPFPTACACEVIVPGRIPSQAASPSLSGSQGPVCVSLPLGSRALPWLLAEGPFCQALALGISASRLRDGGSRRPASSS